MLFLQKQQTVILATNKKCYETIFESISVTVQKLNFPSCFVQKMSLLHIASLHCKALWVINVQQSIHTTRCTQPDVHNWIHFNFGHKPETISFDLHSFLLHWESNLLRQYRAVRINMLFRYLYQMKITLKSLPQSCVLICHNQLAFFHVY